MEITEEMFKPYKNSKITTVIFDESVKNIKVVTIEKNCVNTSPFSLFENLTNITIPNSVTSIGKYAFFGCSSLKTIKIGKIIEQNCLYEIFCGNFNTIETVEILEDVTSIVFHAFACCKSLKQIIVQNAEQVNYLKNAGLDDSKEIKIILSGAEYTYTKGECKNINNWPYKIAGSSESSEEQNKKQNEETLKPITLGDEDNPYNVLKSTF